MNRSICNIQQKCFSNQQLYTAHTCSCPCHFHKICRKKCDCQRGRKQLVWTMLLSNILRCIKCNLRNLVTLIWTETVHHSAVKLENNRPVSWSTQRTSRYLIRIIKFLISGSHDIELHFTTWLVFSILDQARTPAAQEKNSTEKNGFRCKPTRKSSNNVVHGTVKNLSHIFNNRVHWKWYKTAS